MSFETVQDIVQFIQDEDVKFVDVRFTDVPGTEHHFSCLLYTSDAADE